MIWRNWRDNHFGEGIRSEGWDVRKKHKDWGNELIVTSGSFNKVFR
jgi:hypothetical protein